MGVIEVKQAKDRIISILTETNDIVRHDVEPIKEKISQIVTEVRSEDSNLANSFVNYNKTLSSVSTAMNSVLEAIKNEWTSFCDLSIKNEEELGNQINQETAQLDELFDISEDILGKYGVYVPSIDPVLEESTPVYEDMGVSNNVYAPPQSADIPVPIAPLEVMVSDGVEYVPAEPIQVPTTITQGAGGGHEFGENSGGGGHDF